MDLCRDSKPGFTYPKNILKWSRYSFFTEIDDGVLVFSLLSFSMVYFSDTVLSEVKSFEFNYSQNDIINLFRMRYLDADDKETIDGFIEKNRKNSVKETYGIFTTRACNARCYYCFQDGMIKSFMNREIAEKTAEFIMQTHKNEDYRIHWFGGEPLVNTEAIDTVCTVLNSYEQKYHSTMSSNGYLFDRNLISRARKEWKLEKVQIPIDGTEEKYNSIKNYIDSSENPYKRVMNNIHMLLENGVNVSVRLNLSLVNARDMISLAEQLKDIRSVNKNISAYIHLLYEYDDQTSETNKSTLLYYYNILNGILYDSDLYRGELPNGFSSVCCMADSEKCFTVMPDGSIGKCEHHDEKLSVGNIYDGLTKIQLADSFKTHELNERCSSCMFYPICKILKICEIRKCTILQTDTWKIDLKYSMLKLYKNWKYADKH